MPPVLWRVCVIACLAAVALAGIDWGLPSSDADATLFASHATWDGRTLAGFDADRVNTDRADDELGADVDRDPLDRAAPAVPLNDTDAARAAIVRRYRLFSHQPDEMITFMALQRMKPAAGDFDPRLYQYGGLWVYPVGGLLKLAAALGLVDLRPDKAFYYDHPDAFGRFYVVARAYTLLAYVAVMTLAGMIAWRLTGDDVAAAVASAVVGALPVVFAVGHEAKPHLAGAALVLATVLAGARWVSTARWRDALLCGALAGCAAGMVLSAAVAAAVPVTMVFLHRSPLSRQVRDSPARRLGTLAVALSAAGLAFAASNPYVVLHAARSDAVLRSNLANSRAMYAVGQPGEIAARGGALLVTALSWPAAGLAAVGFVVAVTRRQRTTPLGVLLAVPTVLVLGQFVLLSAGKPAEYARFAVMPAAALGVLGVWAVSTVRVGWLRTATLAGLPPAVLLVGTLPYVRAFAADTGEVNTRAAAAAVLREAASASPGGTLAVFAEPAPYAVPPVDLWAWKITLKRTADAAASPSSAPAAFPATTADASVRAVDEPAAVAAVPAGFRRVVVGGDWPAPITWANKPFELIVRDAAPR